MNYKIRKTTIYKAYDIHNCVQGLLQKYKDFKEKHPEALIEDAVITRLENHYKALGTVLEPFENHETIIYPCSILDLEASIANHIMELYDEFETDLKRLRPKNPLQTQKTIDTADSITRITNVMEEIHGTLTWHIEKALAT